MGTRRGSQCYPSFLQTSDGMREKIEDELNKLVVEETVEYSDWAAPIVAVIESDRKSVRVCGEFKVVVNPVSKLKCYPIPRIEDIFATL